MMKYYELVLVPKEMSDSDLEELMTLRDAMEEFGIKKLRHMINLSRSGLLALYLMDNGVRVIKREVKEALADEKLFDKIGNRIK